MLTIVASVGLNNELGKEGDLCWHIGDDLRHFKELTLGGTVIMGRKTWESLPRRPLPGRENIVVTTIEGYDAPGALTAPSLEEAIAMASRQPVFIIGGESIYRQALPMADTLQLTRIHAAEPAADKHFPEITEGEWRIEKQSEAMTGKKGIGFIFETWTRV